MTVYDMIVILAVGAGAFALALMVALDILGGDVEGDEPEVVREVQSPRHWLAGPFDHEQEGI